MSVLSWQERIGRVEENLIRSLRTKVSARVKLQGIIHAPGTRGRSYLSPQRESNMERVA